MNTDATTDKIAKLKRALKTAPASIKDKIRSKVKELKQSVTDAKVPTKKLAVSLLGSQKKVDAYSNQEFATVLKRLSNKPEYHFLKTKNTKSKVKEDIGRHAKAVGWRFKGQHNYKKPTQADIDADSGKPFDKRRTYYEGRSNRSDVVFPVKLAKGGALPSLKWDFNSDSNLSATAADGTEYELVYDDKGEVSVYRLKRNGKSIAASNDIYELKKIAEGGGKKMEEGGNAGWFTVSAKYDPKDRADLLKKLKEFMRLTNIGGDIESHYDRLTVTNLTEKERNAMSVVIDVDPRFIRMASEKMADGGNVSLASIDAPPSMPREQYERINAEAEQIQFAAGGNINSVIDKHVAIAKICDKHNCRASEYYAAQKHYDKGMDDKFDSEWFEEKIKPKMDKGGNVSGDRKQKEKNILASLKLYPDNAKHWNEATDELPDLHNSLAEYFPGYKGSTHVKNGGTLRDDVRSSPSLRNKTHKAAIKKLIKKLDDIDFESFYDHYKHWFEQGKGMTMAKGGKVGGSFHDKELTAFFEKKLGKKFKRILDAEHTPGLNRYALVEVDQPPSPTDHRPYWVFFLVTKNNKTKVKGEPIKFRDLEPAKERMESELQHLRDSHKLYGPQWKSRAQLKKEGIIKKEKGGKVAKKPGPVANQMLGETGLITDKRSLFKGQHGTILHDRGKQWVVEVEENGKKRKVWVSKHGFNIIGSSDPAGDAANLWKRASGEVVGYAKGGAIPAKVARMEKQILAAIKKEGGAARLYDKWEDVNEHSANVLLMAHVVNDKAAITEARDILSEHERKGHLTDELRERRTELVNKIGDEFDGKTGRS